MQQPKTMQEFHNAGLLGALALKEAGTGAEPLAPELKGLADSIAKSISDLRTANEGAISGKADAGAVEKLQANVDLLEKRFAEDMQTIKFAKADEMTDDDRAFGAEFMSTIMQKKTFVEDVTAEMIAEAKNYDRDFQAYARTGEQKGMFAGSDPDGGFWVPTTRATRINQKVFESTPMRALANVETIPGDTWELENDREKMVARWADELTGSKESATTKIGLRTIKVHDLQAMPTATRNLLEDASRDVEAYLSGKAAQAFSLAEATAFIRGDGVSRARGIMTYPMVEYTKADEKADKHFGKMAFVKSGAAAGFGNLDGFAKLISSLKTIYRANARFMMERMSLYQLRILKDADGRYILDPAASNRSVASVFGFPVTDGDDLDEMKADAYPLVFGDFRRAYTIVNRRGIRVLRDPFTAKPKVQYDFTMRVGGDVEEFDAIRAMKIAA